MDVSHYTSLQLELHADRTIEIILVTEGLTNWNDRLRYIHTHTATKEKYTISLADFKNDKTLQENIGNIKSIVFSVQGDYQNFTPFYLEVANVAFAKETDSPAVATPVTENEEVQEVEEQPSEETVAVETIAQTKVIKLSNYPNPFTTHTTIQVPGNHNEVEMIVVDMIGRTVRKERMPLVDNTLTFVTKNLIPGVYQYVIRANIDKKYTGKFLIR